MTKTRTNKIKGQIYVKDHFVDKKNQYLCDLLRKKSRKGIEKWFQDKNNKKKKITLLLSEEGFPEGEERGA